MVEGGSQTFGDSNVQPRLAYTSLGNVLDIGNQMYRLGHFQVIFNPILRSLGKVKAVLGTNTHPKFKNCICRKAIVSNKQTKKRWRTSY